MLMGMYILYSDRFFIRSSPIWHRCIGGRSPQRYLKNQRCLVYRRQNYACDLFTVCQWNKVNKWNISLWRCTYDLHMFLNIMILIHSLLFIKKNVNSHKSGLILLEKRQMSVAMLRVRPLTMVIKLDDEYFVEHCKSIQKKYSQH